MTPQRETLASALDRVSTTIAHALAEAVPVYQHYTRLCENDQSWRESTEPTALAEEDARRVRTEAGMYAANLLVEQLRVQARAAAERFPTVGVSGELLSPMPPSNDPYAIRDWWEDLSDSDRSMVMTRNPSWVGSTDGLPMRARHKANLRLLETELANRAHLVGDNGEPIPDLDEEDQRDLRGLLRLQQLFDPKFQDSVDLTTVTTPLQERFLYLLDARQYPLRIAIVLGDIDHADHVVVHVPGATTTVDLRLFREATWLSNLRSEAVRILGGDTRRVAILDWIGYQAPYDIARRRALGDSGASVLVPGEASDDQYARAGAPYLIRCAEGVRAIVGPDVRLVASGHSYGASVFGLALQETDVFDAAMVVGCPGMFVTSIDQLKIPPNTLFAAVAPGDVVALLNFFGIQVIQIAGVQILAPVPRTTTYPGGQRALLRLAVGHETYYDLGSVSLHGLAGIVVGDMGRVKTTSLAWLSRITGMASNATMPAIPIVVGSGG
ncbi:MAG TPA: alpha/beta hydrolase [Dermatophilaceae bacterium]|nr:alpha/beta hydrolase [Dermatophilaceae bacterium]